MTAALKALPEQIVEALALDKQIDQWAEHILHKDNALFLGRGLHFPISLEGALKLKEISYIHAEAYPAGELKHGPLALVDENMPIVAIAPQDELLEKVLSNLHEVEARGGELFILAGEGVNYEPEQSNLVHIIKMPAVSRLLSPLVYTIPLQLLSYKVALMRGTDVDQPRNLAKSVTVE
jgi:glucosamine--fructose-6-phosphate aminotransferase (isomerizing)